MKVGDGRRQPISQPSDLGPDLASRRCRSLLLLAEIGHRRRGPLICLPNQGGGSLVSLVDLGCSPLICLRDPGHGSFMRLAQRLESARRALGEGILRSSGLRKIIEGAVKQFFERFDPDVECPEDRFSSIRPRRSGGSLFAR